MKLKESPYYSEDFLGKRLYNNISDNDEIYTVQEFFELSNVQKEYHIKNEYNDYKLKVFDNYYELDCQDYGGHLYLVFDKPVYVMGKYCGSIISSEILIKSDSNIGFFNCVTDKLIVNTNCKIDYRIYSSKANNIYFYNMRVTFWYSEISNFFILNKTLSFLESSRFLECFKIKCFGSCDDLRKKMLNDANFKQRIIHIE